MGLRQPSRFKQREASLINNFPDFAFFILIHIKEDVRE